MRTTGTNTVVTIAMDMITIIAAITTIITTVIGIKTAIGDSLSSSSRGPRNRAVEVRVSSGLIVAAGPSLPTARRPMERRRSDGIPTHFLG